MVIQNIISSVIVRGDTMLYFILYNIKLQSSTFELIINLVLLNQDRHQGKNVRQYVRHLPLKISDKSLLANFRGMTRGDSMVLTFDVQGSYGAGNM